jgi:DNA-binding beta-propeller fold protein YncE
VAGVGCLLWAVVHPAGGPELKSYRIGLRPQDVVFTAEAMWVTDPGADTVYRVDPDHGIRSVHIPQAFEVVADHSTLWISHQDGITALRPDGRVGPTVPVPGLPGDMVVAGRFLWLTLPDGGAIARIDLRTTAVTRFPIGRAPSSITSAGGVIWVTDAEADELFEVDAVTGQLRNTIETGEAPKGVFTDGSTLWVANRDSSTVTELDVHDLTRRDFRVPDWPTDLVAHDGTLWVLSQRAHMVSAVDISTGEVQREVDLDGEPLKLEVHESSLVITNPGLGMVQLMPLNAQLPA